MTPLSATKTATKTIRQAKKAGKLDEVPIGCVIVRDGKNYAPPIYDNGGSLLAWATDEELTDTKLRYQFDKAKPFRSHHAQQIKMIDEPVLPTRDLDELYSEIIQSISPILALLSEKRASAIRQYLKYRLHYLKAAMG